MVVAVAQPQQVRQQQVQQRERPRDIFEDVLLGLNIANSAFGLVTDFKTIQKLDQEREINKQRLVTGERAQAQADLFAKGVVPRGILTGQQAKGEVEVMPDIVGPLQEGVQRLRTQGVGPEGSPLETVRVRKLQTPLTAFQEKSLAARESEFARSMAARKDEFLASEQSKKAALAAKNQIDQNRLKLENDKTIRKENREEIKRYSNHPTTKVTDKLVGTYQAINGIPTSSDKRTQQDDIALVFMFMKMLDPDSVVRESEFAVAQHAGTVKDRMANWFGRNFGNTRLTDQQVDAMKRVAANRLNQQFIAQQFTDTQFRDIAGRTGLDADLIIGSQYEPLKEQLAGMNLTDGATGVPGLDVQALKENFDAEVTATQEQQVTPEVSQQDFQGAMDFLNTPSNDPNVIVQKRQILEILRGKGLLERGERGR